jgi:hypothetical protein
LLICAFLETFTAYAFAKMELGFEESFIDRYLHFEIAADCQPFFAAQRRLVKFYRFTKYSI